MRPIEGSIRITPILIGLMALSGMPAHAASGENYLWAIAPALGAGVAGSARFAYGLQAERAIDEHLQGNLGFLSSGLGGNAPQSLSGNLFLAGVDEHLQAAQSGLWLGARAGLASVTFLDPGAQLTISPAFAAGPAAGYDLDLGNGVRMGPEISYLFITHPQATSITNTLLRFRFRF